MPLIHFAWLGHYQHFVTAPSSTQVLPIRGHGISDPQFGISAITADGNRGMQSIITPSALYQWYYTMGIRHSNQLFPRWYITITCVGDWIIGQRYNIRSLVIHLPLHAIL